MKTSLILGIMATTLAVAGAIAPAAFALTQSANPSNTNSNDQTNTQTSTQTATIAGNLNIPRATVNNGGGNGGDNWISSGNGGNGVNLGIVSQNAHQHADAQTQQDQQSVQKAANVNLSVQSNRISQTAVCVFFNIC